MEHKEKIIKESMIYRQTMYWVTLLASDDTHFVLRRNYFWNSVIYSTYPISNYCIGLHITNLFDLKGH
jgi:hypothetical protein